MILDAPLMVLVGRSRDRCAVGDHCLRARCLDQSFEQVRGFVYVDGLRLCRAALRLRRTPFPLGIGEPDCGYRKAEREGEYWNGEGGGGRAGMRLVISNHGG